MAASSLSGCGSTQYMTTQKWLRLQVHIRHGDKWREAKETPTLTYFEKAQQLQVLHQLSITLVLK